MFVILDVCLRSKRFFYAFSVCGSFGQKACESAGIEAEISVGAVFFSSSPDEKVTSTLVHQQDSLKQKERLRCRLHQHTPTLPPSVNPKTFDCLM